MLPTNDCKVDVGYGVRIVVIVVIIVYGNVMSVIDSIVNCQNVIIHNGETSKEQSSPKSHVDFKEVKEICEGIGSGSGRTDHRRRGGVTGCGLDHHHV